MTVSCATVKRAFGEFQCCPECHAGLQKLGKESDLCCMAAGSMAINWQYYWEPITHPALLKALEEEANEPV